MFCISKTTKGTPCTRKASNGEYCTQHYKIYSKPAKILEYIIPEITDDIMLNHIIYSMDIVSLTNLSRVSHRSRVVLANESFWNAKFKELPFFYKIPKTTAKIIKEYRRIYEANVLTDLFFGKMKTEKHHPNFSIMGGSLKDWTKWLNSISFILPAGTVDIEKISKYIKFGLFEDKYYVVIEILISKSTNLGNCKRITMNLENCKRIFTEAIYHIKFPEFNFSCEHMNKSALLAYTKK